MRQPASTAPARPAPRDSGAGADGALADALDQQRASNQPQDGAVRIGLTFKTPGRGYCRSFTLPATGTAGLARRAGDPLDTSGEEAARGTGWEH